MTLSFELKRLLRENKAKEPEQVRAKNSQALRLNLDGRSVTLVNRLGMSTEAGRYFYRQVRKQPLPDSRWDHRMMRRRIESLGDAQTMC